MRESVCQRVCAEFLPAPLSLTIHLPFHVPFSTLPYPALPRTC
jgi:hypothetical protein